MVTTITSKGQLTLPLNVREHLGVKPGDRVDFVIHKDGRIEVLAVQGSIQKLKGLLPKPTKLVSLEDMQAAIESGASQIKAKRS